MCLQTLHDLRTFLSRNLVCISAQPVTFPQRTQTLTWLFELAYTYGLSAKTMQLACCYLDEVAIRLRDERELKVIALTCLFVASKMEETAALAPSTVAKVTGLTEDEVLQLELYVLVTLNWNLDRLTSAELIRLMLIFQAPGHDFSQVILESDCFASIGYQDAALASKGPVVVALASVCCALERHSSLEFRDQWLDTVLPATALSKSDVSQATGLLWTQLRERFQTETAHQASN